MYMVISNGIEVIWIDVLETTVHCTAIAVVESQIEIGSWLSNKSENDDQKLDVWSVSASLELKEFEMKTT